jgi:hypothetical protein
LKKLAGSVRFYKQKIEKTNPNRNRKNQKKTEPKPSQTGKTKPTRKSQAKPEKTEPKPEKTEPKPEKLSQTGLNRFFP